MKEKTTWHCLLTCNHEELASLCISPNLGNEPIIVSTCERLSLMNAPLCKDQVVSLANSIINGGTEYEKKGANLPCFVCTLPKALITRERCNKGRIYNIWASFTF